MEVASDRSRWSHNFTSAPIFKLKWGRRKHLRCVKESDFINLNFRKQRSPSDDNCGSDADGDGGNGDGDGGIEAMREKLMSDLRTEVNQMRAALFDGGKHSPPPSPAEKDEVRPWNLRTRRAICKGHNGGNVFDRKPNFSPVKNSNVKSPGDVTVDGGEKGIRRKFAITLSKIEISEDFMAMTGGRPARRPRKRPKYLQKQVDAMLPGFWLSEITADMYKVKEQLPDITKK